MGRETGASHTHTNLKSPDNRSTTFSSQRTRTVRRTLTIVVHNSIVVYHIVVGIKRV